MPQIVGRARGPSVSAPSTSVRLSRWRPSFDRNDQRHRVAAHDASIGFRPDRRLRCTLSFGECQSSRSRAALCTLLDACSTSIAKTSNISVNREDFEAQATLIVFTPYCAQRQQGTRVRRTVSNCIVSIWCQLRAGAWSAQPQRVTHSGHSSSPPPWTSWISTRFSSRERTTDFTFQAESSVNN